MDKKEDLFKIKPVGNKNIVVEDKRKTEEDRVEKWVGKKSVGCEKHRGRLLGDRRNDLFCGFSGV